MQLPRSPMRLSYTPERAALISSTQSACLLLSSEPRNLPSLVRPLPSSNQEVLWLVYNVVVVTVCWIRGGGVIIFLLANIYALLGILLSYLLWYRLLYYAIRTDSALKFGFLLLPDSHWLLYHCCYCSSNCILWEVIVGYSSSN